MAILAAQSGNLIGSTIADTNLTRVAKPDAKSRALGGDKGLKTHVRPYLRKRDMAAIVDQEAEFARQTVQQQIGGEFSRQCSNDGPDVELRIRIDTGQRAGDNIANSFRLRRRIENAEVPQFGRQILQPSRSDPAQLKI